MEKSMRRKGNLIEKAAAIENLEQAYCRARRGKVERADVRAFGADLGANLAALRAELLSGAVRVGNYHYFTVYDKKIRTICAAPFRERVLHHALMRVCDPVFERHQIFDSYASRRGKGTFAALNRARAFTRRYGWYLKLDVRKYFDGIEHGILKAQLRRLFKDARMLHVLDTIVDSYAATPGRGVPIGNLTSQYFANHYLSTVDRFAKETLRVPAYIRYMDDMILWSNEKTELIEAGRRFVEFTEDTLSLSLKPFCFNHSDRGLPCLGFVVFPHQVRLDSQSRNRFRAGMASAYDALLSGTLSQRGFAARATALAAHTEHADAREFRGCVMKQFGYRPRVRIASIAAAVGTTTR
jgi:RNA-directed DNA polymerase